MRRYLPLLMLVCACGDPLVEGTFKPPYFTLDIYSSRTPGFQPQHVNAAVMWLNDTGDGRDYATQLFAFTDANPTGEFKLPINALPPPAAIHPILPLGNGVDPETRFAEGTLVLYADNNQNGQLDIAETVVNDPAHDQIVAVAEQIDVFYLAQGAPAPASFVSILPVTSGFSLVQEPMLSDPPLGSCDSFNARGHLSQQCAPGASDQPTALPNTTQVQLQIVDDPLLQRYDCANFLGPEQYSDVTLAPPNEVCDSPSCPYCIGYTCTLDVPPPGVAVTCNSEGTAYAYKTCTNVASLCDTTVCHYGHGARLATDPIPAGWPCPTP